MDSTAALAGVIFGFELEFVMPGKTWEEASSALSEALEYRLGKIGFRGEVAVRKSKRDGQISYDNWNIVAEDDVESLGKSAETEIGLEIEVWKALNKFDVKVNKRCGTHVHVSFPAFEAAKGEAGTTNSPIQSAKFLAIAALYFEDCIDATIIPEHRRAKNFVMAKCCLVRNLKFPGAALRVAWTIIQHQVVGRQELAQLICPGTDTNSSDRYYRWNFIGFNHETIEFRQPPGTTNATETKDWIIFTCLFALASRRLDMAAVDGMLSRVAPYPHDLKKFLLDALPARSDEQGQLFWENSTDEFWSRMLSYGDRVALSDSSDSSDRSSEDDREAGCVLRMEDLEL
ncbi:hypothetical protein BJ170DRAFT_690727 [Xylariales sp. AK1849]|nr:hypothetical protein BJ170DRAFT_690727 [Xylariales sp. AK1849]